jgi:hypothetical protein
MREYDFQGHPEDKARALSFLKMSQAKENHLKKAEKQLIKAKEKEFFKRFGRVEDPLGYGGPHWQQERSRWSR